MCVANTFRCKVPHKKAFFAVLTDERYRHLFTPDERDLMARAHPVDPAGRRRDDELDGRRIDLLEHVRAHRESSSIKPNDEYGGAGVVLGWESGRVGLGRPRWIAPWPRRGAWVVQRRIPVRREVFPMVEAPQAVVDARHARRPRAVLVPRQAWPGF